MLGKSDDKSSNSINSLDDLSIMIKIPIICNILDKKTKKKIVTVPAYKISTCWKANMTRIRTKRVMSFISMTQYVM